MSKNIQHEDRDGVVVLRLDRPVANALVPEMRSELLDLLREAAARADCAAIVIAGAGAGFCSGLDLAEHDRAPVAPTAGDLCRAVAACARPVVAALHGSVLGAGLSLALAAHARVADAETRLCLPEIGLGMMPGAGVTQRLPRIVGAQAALELMLSGRQVRGSEARLRPLFDQLVTGGAEASEAAAVTLAARLARGVAAPAPLRGLSDPAGYQKAIASVRARLGPEAGAAADIVRAVEAAQLLPLEQGLDFEQVLCEERAQSCTARALRHVHLVQSRARALPEMRQAAPRALRRIALAGPVPFGFVEALHATGCALRAAPGSLPEGLRPRIEPGEAAGWADLYIDATPDGVGVGEAARVRLDTGTGFGGAGLWLRVHAPERFAEIGVGPGYAAADVAGLARLLSEAGLGYVRATLPAAGPGPGHALRATLDLAALALVRAGLSPQVVDDGALALGLAEAPCLAMDREGLAEAAQRLEVLAPRLGLPAPEADGPLADRLMRGAVGRRAGRGFYDHPPEGPRAPRSPAAEAVLPDGISADRALHAALVNVAERLIGAGAVLRAGDIDVVAIHALDQARESGGPLFRADARGLMAVLKDMKALAPVSGPLWSPQPGVQERIREGLGYFGRRAAAISQA